MPTTDDLLWFDGEPAPGSGDKVAYTRFLLERTRFPLGDEYAAYQPFNEAGRTWRAFRTLVQEILSPGDLILDLGNRTGWSGVELASAFPEQTIISCWEGDSDVLGHRGFRYWFGGRHRPSNLHLAFLPREAALPLPSGSVRLIHGHDVLHHRDPEAFFPEVARVLKPDGCAIFPHVHTADADPDPWFQRGGTLRRAQDYRVALDRIAGPERRGLVLGETQLFQAMGDDRAHLVDDPAVSDCNVIVVLTPACWTGRALNTDGADESGTLLINPLININPVDGSISIPDNPSHLAARLLPRHPVYADRMRKRLPTQLDHEARLLCYWASRLPSATAIAARLGLSVEHIQARVADLHHAEVLCARLLPTIAARLQRCHGTGADLPNVNEDHPRHVWNRAIQIFPSRPCLVLGSDDEWMSYAQTDIVVRALARRMVRAGIGPGAAVLIADVVSAESLLLIWAATLRSATVVVCDPTAKPPHLEGLRIAAVFARVASWARDGAELIGPDLATPAGWTPLPEWYTNTDLAGDDPEVDTSDPDAPGAVLFTSGSSGVPKGVLLSWSALARSARSLALHYHWSETDRLLNLGGLHTMSGLRNPTWAAIAAGAAIVIPPTNTAISALDIAETAGSRRATILGAAPATLQALLAADQRIGRLPALRQIICTGSRLPVDLRLRFRERHPAVTVCNYYGLTETCGFCIGDSPDGANGENIGRPVEALLRIVDEFGADVPAGSNGELLVHSSNLMIGYLGQTPPKRTEHWYHTGDLARIDSDGTCVLVGRLREIVKNSNGEIVSCREVEDALMALPDVADAAVLPDLDESDLERAQAWVVPCDPSAGAPWLDDLRRRLFSELGAKRMPSIIHLCPNIPRTANGKLRRLELTKNIS